MLIKIELENFFSIKEPICLDFRAGNINTTQSRELSHNIFEWKGTKFLKSIGLFGANASGKSNILKAINFCCRLILESHQHNEGVIFNFQPFKFSGMAEKPSRFKINFICENIEYEYSFALTREEILEESLYHYPNGRKAKIFTRNEMLDKKYSFAEGSIPRPMDIVLNTSRKNLFLSRSSSMNRPIAQKIYRYFLNTFLLGFVSLNDKITEEYFTKYKKVILHAMSICDSDICNIDIEHEKIQAPVPSNIDKMNLSFIMQDMDIIRFKTFHRHSPDVSFDMEKEESNGTKQLFSILIRLLDVVRNGKSLMLDEFDTSLHTRLADFVLDLIHASSQSQLLFSSHNINLIDMKRLRRDQIVFVNKRRDGSSEIYSLYDYKDFRENMDAAKGYTQGRFEAIPFVDSSSKSLKKMLEE